MSNLIEKARESAATGSLLKLPLIRIKVTQKLLVDFFFFTTKVLRLKEIELFSRWTTLGFRQ